MNKTDKKNFIYSIFLTNIMKIIGLKFIKLPLLFPVRLIEGGIVLYFI